MKDELLQRAAAGDSAAQQDLVDNNAKSLRRYLDRHMGIRMQRAVSAADLSQEVFTRVFQALASMPEDATARTFRRWLYRHANWVLSNHGNRAGRHVGESVAGSGYEHETPQASQGEVTLRDEVVWLQELISRLEPKYADVVRLRLQSKSFAEIAEQLQINEDTARQRHARVLRILREQGGKQPE